MYSFPDMEPDCCSMSSSDCCFLNCIQIYMKPHVLQSMGSQRVEHDWAGQVIWYSYLSKNFPQFVVIYIVKGFSIVNEPKEIFLWNCFAFLMSQWMLKIWSLVPLSFVNSAWTSGSSWCMYCWSLAWRILRITLLACEMSAIVKEFEHSFALPFFVIGMKTELFQSCDHCWVSKFAGILNAALSQHHLWGFESALLELHHLH